MAKDDYYMLVGKILVYLYAKLKGKNDQKAGRISACLAEE